MEDKRAERLRSNSAQRFNSAQARPLWNPMWHAIPFQLAAIAERSDGGPSSGDFEIREPGVETGQSDTLSADANLLTGPRSSREATPRTAGEASGDGNPPPGASRRDRAGLAMMPGLPMALPFVSTPSVTEIQPGRGGMLEASALLAHRPAEPAGTANRSGGAELTTDLIPDAPASVGSGLAPLLTAPLLTAPFLTNSAFVPPAMFTPLATVGSANRGTPDFATLEATALDGPGTDEKTAPEGFLLDAREWLPVSDAQAAWTAVDGSSTDPIPVAIPSPIAQPPVFDRLSRPPAPTSTGRPLPPDSHGPTARLAGVNLENTLPGAGAIQDPVSFVVRVAEERPLLGGSSPELPKLRDPETLVGSRPETGDRPSLEKALGRAREGSFDRVGKDPGTVLVRSMAALDSSVGGQAEGGDPHHHPFAREESALPNEIPRAGGGRDFSSWVPGHGAEMAGQLTPNESGSGTGVTTAKLHETAELTPELAPERLTAAPRELVLTIPGSSDGEGILASVHVRDHHGSVEIAVRTPDAQLSSSLQDGLPELVARLETQGAAASATRGDQMSGGEAGGGPADWSGMQDGPRQEGQPQEGRAGQEPGGGGRGERQQHPEERGQPRGQPDGQPGGQIRELRQQRQARWQASLGLASR